MTTQKEKALSTVYGNIMQVMQGKAAFDLIADNLADDLIMIGTTADEKLMSSKDFRSLIERQNDQSAGMNILYEIKPISRSIAADEKTAIYIDEMALQFRANNLDHQFLLRVSFVFEYKNRKWMLVHGHASKPENVQSEVDTYGVDEWKKKNEELERIINERTKELKNKNKELEIEAALEKIRSTSLAMRHTSELQNVVSEVFIRLKELGLVFNGGVGIHFFNEATHDAEIWVAAPDDISPTSKINLPFDEPGYKNNPLIQDVWKAKESGIDLFNKHYSREEKNNYFQYVFKHNDRAIPPSVKDFIFSADSYTVTAIAEKNSQLVAQSWTRQEFTLEQFELLKRIGKVFEQSYLRFLDLKKAEAQTREAQVESSLEKVRSRSLAMHSSNEIQDVAYILYGELKKLNFQFGACSVYLIDDADNIEAWVAGFESSDYPQRLFVPKFDHPLYNQQIHSFRAGKKYDELYLTPDIKQAYDDHMFLVSDYKKLKPELQQMMRSMPSVVFAMAYNKYGALHWGPGKLTEDEANIFQKFSTVFEQAYTRFLDLQKAEAQGRDAQIELALERVRSRTMAMHKSEELREVIIILYDQLKSLGFNNGASSITFMDAITGDMDWWMEGSRDGYIFLENYKVKYFNHKSHIEQLDNWKNGASYAIIKVSGEEKKEYDTVYFNDTDFARVPKETKEMMMQQETVNFSMAYFLYGSLSWSPSLLSNEQAKILQRFAKIFEQSYIRFLDLQKAEAQAKEAKIEAALEKIRSTSLAMHKGEELKNVVSILFQKLKELELTFDVAGIQLYTENSKDIVQWVAAPDLLTAPILAKLPYVDKDFKESEILRDFWAAKEMGKSYCNKHYSFNEKNKFFEYAGRHNDFDTIPADVRGFQLNAPGYTQTLIAEKRSSLWVDSYSGQTIPNEGFDILKRFARVFEQAYVRFLDLQKAEAQTREAQIQLALERVRAASMAMQHSNQLKEIAATTLQQLQSLGFTYGACSIVIMDAASGDSIWWISGFEKDYPTSYRIPYVDHPFYLAQLNNWKEGKKYAVMKCGGQDKKTYDDYIFSKTEFVSLPDELAKIMQAFKKITFSNAYMQHGALSWSTEPLTEEHAKILQRFSGVFEQSYTRFLDLQKAEAQAREATIEAALEKIRSRSLAMHHSEELKEVMGVMFKKLTELEILIGTVGILLFDDKTKNGDFWLQNQLQEPGIARLPYDEKMMNEDNYMRNYWEAKTKGESFFNRKENIEQKNRHFEYVFAHNDIPQPVREYLLQAQHHTQTFIVEKNSALLVDSWDERIYSDEQIEVLKRVAKVFEQAYIRFLDLQKAEAQARESKIEATLERIRSRAMAMNTSDELNTLIGFTYSECLKLNMHLDRGFIMTFDSVTNDANWWMVGSESPDKPSKLLVKYHEHAPNLAILDGWHRREQKWSYFLGGENKKNWDDYTLVKTDLALLPDFVIQDMRSVENIFLNASFQNFGCIMLSSFEPMSDEHFDLLVRISKVFDFTYTRFLDLKSKEEQLREAQIETALEKIRSRSLAMHQSDELHEVMKVLFEKMKELNVIKGTLALQLFDEEKNSSDFWVSNEIQHISKVSLPYRKEILESNGYMKDCWKAYLSKVDIINKMYPMDQKDRYFDYVFASNDTATIPTHVRDFINNNPDQIQCLLVEKHSCIFVDNWEAQPFEEDQIKILKRVVKVFDQSYIRFLDLQKAEEQTREAQIETSLERIRAATLAMQSTDQLSSVILFIYGELNKITSELNRCFFMIFDPQNLGVTWWMAGVDTPDLGKGFFVPYSEHAPQMAYLKGWQEKKERWQYRMQGDEKRKWDNYLFHHTDLARLPDVIKDNMQAFTDIYLDGSFNSFGCLTTGSPIPLSTKAVDLLVRYSKVFDLSFTRYNDLKQAEAQARESQIETALEKIRSSSLAMQKSHEIKSVVTTLFQKLKELKVDFNGAAAIHIFNDTTKDAVIWVATPTLESTIEVQLPYDADYFTDNPIITDIWHAKETGQDIITKIYPLQEKNRYFQYVFKHNPQIPDFEQKRIYNELNYSATFIAQPNSLLGVNSWSDNQLITDEQYKLLKRVGYVFEQAYVRFLDLQKAEALAEQARLDLIQIQTEKKRAEDALKELSATQAQLIQSEKMASLGELTAGIAHEIQNPLNFVNNFSEINNDLINELKEEFEKGNKQQATELINDIKINSEKIHHHGHRASSIVKNMLEHSRKSSGVKSLTDINALCDEFLRLAYHGLRGRDKSFNSDYSIDPDLSLPKINVISQDISRVILNLVTNAFYAVCEKSKQFNIQDYKPEVTVKTRKIHEEIEIHINDNGPGIPDSIKDKIFQPFFTTKPTGQGTGLGLSLSYDIVKAHGGSIKVSSPEGHGTSFVITLPIA